MDEGIPARDEDEGMTDLARELVAEARRYLRAEAGLARLELSQLAREGGERLRLDVNLAKRELTVEAKRLGRAGAITGVGGLLLNAALFLLLFTVVFALARVMPLWAATLIVMVITAGAGGLIAWSGANKLRGVAKPIAAIENLKGDSQWMKQRMRDLRSRILASE